MNIRIASEAARFGSVFSRAASCRRRVRVCSCHTSLASRRAWSDVTAGGYSQRKTRPPASWSARWVSPNQLLPTARAVVGEIAEKSAPVPIPLIRQMMWRMLGADDPMKAH